MNKQCMGCGKPIGTGISTGLCVYCSVNRQIRNDADELAAAKARIADLEKALEPFAREAKRCASIQPDSFAPASVRLTIGELRRAAALLNKE